MLVLPLWIETLHYTAGKRRSLRQFDPTVRGGEKGREGVKGKNGEVQEGEGRGMGENRAGMNRSLSTTH